MSLSPLFWITSMKVKHLSVWFVICGYKTRWNSTWKLVTFCALCGGVSSWNWLMSVICCLSVTFRSEVSVSTLTSVQVQPDYMQTQTHTSHINTPSITITYSTSHRKLLHTQKMSGFVKFLFIKYSVGDSEFLYEQTTGDVCLQTHITVLLNKNFIF